MSKEISSSSFGELSNYNQMARKGTTFAIEPFNGNNDFTLWQQRVKNVLTREGLVKALKKKTDKPEKMKDEEWEELRELANSTIQLYLGNNTLREVINETDPAELWTKLESRYKSRSLTNRLSLKKQLYALQMTAGSNFTDHLDEFNRILTDLEAIDVKIEDEDKAILLLVSLPSSYEHLRTTLMYGKDTLNLDEVVATLISHESMRKRDNEQTSSEGIMVTSSRGQERGGRSPNRDDRRNRDKSRGRSQGRRNIECYHCGKKGHIMRHCRFFKREQEKTGDINNEEKDKSAETSAYLGHEEDVLLTATRTTRSESSDWILDTGCSFHMCGAKNKFSSYEASVGGLVRMGNNTVNRVIGKGTVHFRLKDGRIMKLSNVKHVLGLKRNLISLGMIDSQGCSFNSKEGIMTISKEGKELLQGRKVDGLYRLEGSAMTREAANGFSNTGI